MNRFERRRFFEELCRLRALYRLRSAYDATSVMSIHEAIEHASTLLDHPATAAQVGSRGPRKGLARRAAGR